MKVFAVSLVGFLVAACFVSAEAGLFHSKEADAITLLNNLLVDLTPELSLEANVKAAREFRKMPDYEKLANATLRDAVALFAGINTDELCARANIRRVRELINMGDKANRKEVRRIGSQRRLIRLIYEFSRDAKWHCLRQYQELWAVDKTRSFEFSVAFGELEKLKPFLIRHAKRRVFEDHDDAKELNGAAELLRSSDPEKLFTGWEIKSVLSKIHARKTGFHSLKTDEKTGKPMKLDVATASQLLDKYLVKPCQLLMQRPEAATILEPMAELTAIVRVDDLVRAGGKYAWPSLEWTARYITCELLLDLNLEKLAERMTKCIL